MDFVVYAKADMWLLYRKQNSLFITDWTGQALRKYIFSCELAHMPVHGNSYMLSISLLARLTCEARKQNSFFRTSYPSLSQCYIASDYFQSLVGYFMKLTMDFWTVLMLSSFWTMMMTVLPSCDAVIGKCYVQSHAYPHTVKMSIACGCDVEFNCSHLIVCEQNEHSFPFMESCFVSALAI